MAGYVLLLVVGSEKKKEREKKEVKRGNDDVKKKKKKEGMVRERERDRGVDWIELYGTLIRGRNTEGTGTL